MRFCLLLAVVLGLASTARADQLLAELTGRAEPTYGNPARGMEFHFNATFCNSNTCHGEGFYGIYVGAKPDRVGETLHAGESELVLMRPRLNTGFVYFNTEHASIADPSILGSPAADKFFWSDANDPCCEIDMKVPRLGPGLAGYYVTDIAMTIDEVTFFDAAWPARGIGRQTVRIYGHLIPEPSTLLLLAIAVFAALTTHRRKSSL